MSKSVPLAVGQELALAQPGQPGGQDHRPGVIGYDTAQLL